MCRDFNFHSELSPVISSSIYLNWRVLLLVAFSSSFLLFPLLCFNAWHLQFSPLSTNTTVKYLFRAPFLLPRSLSRLCRTFKLEILFHRRNVILHLRFSSFSVLRDMATTLKRKLKFFVLWKRQICIRARRKVSKATVLKAVTAKKKKKSFLR